MDPVYDFSEFPVLETSRLRLRQLRHEDAPALSELFSSPDVLRFLAQPPLDTHDKAIGLIDWFNGAFDKHEGIQWAFTLQGEDKLIGTCGLYDWEREHHYLDIGYHLLPAYWGKGYTTEACKAMIAWSFGHMDLHRIQADCTDGNIASERVLTKCGFKLEGIWRQKYWEHGRFVDNKQFGLLRPEFEALQR